MLTTKTFFTHIFISVGSILLIGFIANDIRAEQVLLDNNGFKVKFKTRIAAAAFTTSDTNFGAGRHDFFRGGNTGDADWQEAYIKPELNFEWDQASDGTVYGAISLVGAGTFGDGDAGGFTGSERDIDLEYLNIGWRGDVFDVSFGSQDYIIGDGFIVMDGNFDAAEDGAFWSLPRKAFQNTAIFRFNTTPIKGEFFYLEADNIQDDTQLVGLNLEHTSVQYGTFGTSFLSLIDANLVTTHLPATSRHGMKVISIRANQAKIPDLPDLTLHAEYVKQFGAAEGNATGDFDGEAWYVEGNYSLSALSWNPTFTYRYAYFSGDDGTDNEQDSFDPLFYSYNPVRNGGWGSWFQGEIVGNYLLFNSNQQNHMLKFDIYPMPKWRAGLIYYSFDLDKNNYFGTPVTDDHFADEINFYIDWLPTNNFYAAVAGGIAFPGDAAEQIFGNDEDYTVFETYFTYSF